MRLKVGIKPAHGTLPETLLAATPDMPHLPCSSLCQAALPGVLYFAVFVFESGKVCDIFRIYFFLNFSVKRKYE